MTELATINNCVADGMAADREGNLWLTCYSQLAHPGVPYGNVVRKKFHADSINGRKMADADSRGRPERA